MTSSPAERLQNWVATRSAETQYLEFKQDLVLTNKKDKIEVLKDLSGMGNGGGGVVVFGVAEAKTPDGESVADHVTELDDPTIPLRLGAIIDSGVRPTLRVTFHRVDRPGGGVMS